MLLVIVCVHRSIACRLEDVVEKLAASLAVLYRVITVHCHHEGNQVGNSYWAIDYRVYTENKGINADTLGQNCKYFTGLTCQEQQWLFGLKSKERVVKI